jgi:DNA-binding transcriptional LysR family regulator
VSFASGGDSHCVVSAGDDCKLRFWDTRMLSKAEPLLELGGHSHWVWRAQFNPYYDQLVASASSDSLVNLYYTPQVAAGAALVQDLMRFDVPSTLTVNNYFGVLQAVLNHLGIGVLPDYLTQDFPNLVRVLPEVESTEVPVFLAYPEELRHSKRVAVFRDFVQDEIVIYRKQMKDQEVS